MSGMHMTMTHSNAAASPKAVQLRIALNQLLGEHAILAIQATQRGLVGGKDFNAVAKAARQQLGRDLEGDRLGVRAGSRRTSS